MITSVIEMLELPNFCHMTTSILRRPRVAIFTDIIKIVTMFIKTFFKDSRKVKRIRNYVLKCKLYLYFLMKFLNVLLDVFVFLYLYFYI